jgi:glucose/mannose transport system substrate-binding protein
MKRSLFGGVSAIVLMLAGGASVAAADFEVIHHFTAQTEAESLKVVADVMEEQGVNWVDNAVAGPPNSRRLYTTRMQAGQPSQAYATVTNRDHLEFIPAGMLVDIEDVATEGKWREVMSPAVIDAISGADGKIYLAPSALYVPNFVFYNKALFEKLDITEPVGFGEDFFAALDALKADGVIPLAFSGDAFHIRFPFEAILLEFGGPELWDLVWNQRSDEAIRGETMREVFETLARMRDYTDEGNIGRAWNLSSNMVSTGEAGVQIMGLWADGEYQAAGFTAGTDFGCFIPGERDYVQLHGDVMVFPKQPGVDGATEDQKKFARIVADPVVQTAAVAPRGALPVRTDAALPDNADLCSTLGYEAINTEGNVLANPRSLITQQMDGEYRDIVNEFWSNPDMSVDEVVEGFASALQAE